MSMHLRWTFSRWVMQRIWHLAAYFPPDSYEWDTFPTSSAIPNYFCCSTGKEAKMHQLHLAWYVADPGRLLAGETRGQNPNQGGSRQDRESYASCHFTCVLNDYSICLSYYWHSEPLLNMYTALFLGPCFISCTVNWESLLLCHWFSQDSNRSYWGGWPKFLPGSHYLPMIPGIDQWRQHVEMLLTTCAC